MRIPYRYWRAAVRRSTATIRHMRFRHPYDDPPNWASQLLQNQQETNERIEKLTMTVNADSQHLSDDVAALGTAIASAVTELKAQIAAHVAPAALDFGPLDALVASTKAEAAADAPPVVPPVV